MASALIHRPSPTSSPSLRPYVSSPSPSPLPIFSSSGSGSGAAINTPVSPNITPGTSPRSYARAATQRPYALGPRYQQKVQTVEGDTKVFTERVVAIIENRARRARTGRALGHEGGFEVEARRGKSMGGSFSGSWENERAELIVDIPVWSPGCFQDLSTLHTLRDSTLSHTHSIMSHLLKAHSIATSYRLLPRSATNNDAANGNAKWRAHMGWGCIRLAPSASSPVQPKRELKPIVRRTSSAFQRRPSVRKDSTVDSASRPSDHVPPFRLDMDQAIVDDDVEEDIAVELKTGYRSGSASDDEAEEECADVIVEREIAKRGVKEGQVFLMTLFGAPALILC